MMHQGDQYQENAVYKYDNVVECIRPSQIKKFLIVNMEARDADKKQPLFQRKLHDIPSYSIIPPNCSSLPAQAYTLARLGLLCSQFSLASASLRRSINNVIVTAPNPYNI
jgi:hypothetical protein